MIGFRLGVGCFFGGFLNDRGAPASNSACWSIRERDLHSQIPTKCSQLPEDECVKILRIPTSGTQGEWSGCGDSPGRVVEAWKGDLW